MATPEVINPSISFQLKSIAGYLSEWAKDQGGMVQICHDLNELWAAAHINSKTPRCILAFLGEDIRGDFAVAAACARVDRHFVCVVTRARGMTQVRGATLVDQVGDSRPFYDLVEEARDIIRAIFFDPRVTEAMPTDPIDYKGISAFMVDNDILDSYKIDFSIGTQLPVITGPTQYLP
jgi:hypothetical protein